MSREQSPVACVVGAGVSGLTAAKALQDRDIPFDCFEQSPRIGGLWAFGNREGTPTAYRSLRINTSKRRTQLEDFPMPDEYPDFPSHEQIAAYLESYVDHFGLRGRISLGSRVERAEPLEDGSWRVGLAGGEWRRYDALIVANGHHWDPLWPEPAIPGRFDGVTMHSRDYDDSAGLEGREVVVVGLGNSALDIAVDASKVARRVTVSTRRGAHILPRRLFGRPLDQIELLAPRPLRATVGGRLAGAAIRAGFASGRIPRAEAYGFPPAEHALGAVHPLVSDELFERIEAGAIEVRPRLSRFAGDRVHFEGGSSAEADVVIFATGYRVSFPFLDPRVVSAPGNSLKLFHRVFKPGLDGISFIGFVQPVGPILPALEAQAKWVAAQICGDYALPPPEEMEVKIAADAAQARRRWIQTPRHRLGIEYWPYLDGLKRELHRGTRRAAALEYHPRLYRARSPRSRRARRRGARIAED